MSLAQLVARSIFGSRRQMGASEFKQKFCGKFQAKDTEYLIAIRDLRAQNTISFNKRVAVLVKSE